MQRARRKVEDSLDARCHDLIDNGLRMRRGNRDDRDVEPLAAGDAPQILDRVDRHAAARFMANLVGRCIEERGNLETFLAKPGVIRKRETEIARAHDRDAQPPIEAENLTEVTTEFFDVVADTADAELTEICEVFANLRSVEVKLLGKPLR